MTARVERAGAAAIYGTTALGATLPPRRVPTKVSIPLGADLPIETGESPSHFRTSPLAGLGVAGGWKEVFRDLEFVGHPPHSTGPASNRR